MRREVILNQRLGSPQKQKESQRASNMLALITKLTNVDYKKFF
jgi:hypothetical protein